MTVRIKRRRLLRRRRRPRRTRLAFRRRRRYRYRLLRRPRRRPRFRRRRRRSSALGKLMKALLPRVPVQWLEGRSLVGYQGCRTYHNGPLCGDYNYAYTYSALLPGGNQYNLMHNDVSATPTTAASLTVANYNSKKFRMKMLQKWKLLNVSNTPAVLTTYYCMVRNNMASVQCDFDSDQGLKAILTIDTTSTPTSDAPRNSMSTASNLPVGANYIVGYPDYPQFTVFDSSLFCSMFKVLKTENDVVPPGGEVYKRIGTKYKEFDYQYVRNNQSLTTTQRTRAHGHWSKIILFSWHGTVGAQVDTAGVPTATSTYRTCFAANVQHTLVCKAVANTIKTRALVPPTGIFNSKAPPDAGVASLKTFARGVIETVVAPDNAVATKPTN